MIAAPILGKISDLLDSQEPGFVLGGGALLISSLLTIVYRLVFELKGVAHDIRCPGFQRPHRHTREAEKLSFVMLLVHKVLVKKLRLFFVFD